MPKPGNRVRLTIQRPSGHLLDQFRYSSPPGVGGCHVSHWLYA